MKKTDPQMVAKTFALLLMEPVGEEISLDLIASERSDFVNWTDAWNVVSGVGGGGNGDGDGGWCS